MSQQSYPFDFSHLTPAERILLAEDLWDSIAAEQNIPPLSAEQQHELERRLALADRGEMAYSPWHEVRQRLTRHK